MSIIDDDLTEGPEVFFMLAQSSDIRVQIRPDQANVTIIDDDRKHDNCGMSYTIGHNLFYN